MNSDSNKPNTQGINRRNLLTAGAAGLAAAGLGAGTAQAKTVIPDQEKLWTNSNTGRRVAIINDALLQIGPPLAIELAQAGHDLVIAQPEEGLVKKLEGLGSKVVVIEGVEQEGPNDETNPEHAKKLVDAAIKNFGGFDSAYFRTALHGGADILNVTKEQLQKSFDSNFVAVVSALQAVLPPLMKAGRGQVVILTSASSVAGTLRLHPLCPLARRGEQADRVRCHDRRGEGRLRQRLRHQLPQLPRRGGILRRRRGHGACGEQAARRPLRRAGGGGAPGDGFARRQEHVHHRPGDDDCRRLQ